MRDKNQRITGKDTEHIQNKVKRIRIGEKRMGYFGSLNYRPALVLHSVLGDSDYTNACICFPCHNKTLTAKLGLGGTWLFFCLPAKALAQAGIEKRPPPLHLLRAIHPRELYCGEISRSPIRER